MSELNLENSSFTPGSSQSKEFLCQALDFAHAIVETVREPLLVLDTELRVKTANSSFYRSFQVLSAETKDRYIYDLGNHQWDIPALRQLLEAVLATGRAFENFEVTHDFQHIGRKTMMLNARQILQKGVQTGMILLAIEDITERKAAEITLQLFTKKLQRSNQELQDFASVASHDLQEPLRKIQAFGDLLVREYGSVLPEPGQEYLKRMQNAAGRMQVLINDLLAFSRVTTKAQPFVPINLQRVVQEVLSDLEVKIQQVNGQVEVGDLPTIDADPLQMRQLFQNLLSNSLKFNRPDQPPLISLQARLVQAPTEAIELCEIWVQDNGIGFEEKYLDRIFTVFQRLHYRNEYEGTGVGLAICRKIAERHGGSITATSKLGEGATFIVTLPVHQSNPGSIA